MLHITMLLEIFIMNFKTRTTLKEDELSKCRARAEGCIYHIRHGYKTLDTQQ